MDVRPIFFWLMSIQLLSFLCKSCWQPELYTKDWELMFYCLWAVKLQLCTVDTSETKTVKQCFIFYFPSFAPLPCYFSAVVRNDLNFFWLFPFLLKLVTFIYFLLFSLCERNSGRCCQIASFSATPCDVCLCENEKRLGMISPSCLLEMDAKRTCGYRLLNKVHWLLALS